MRNRLLFAVLISMLIHGTLLVGVYYYVLKDSRASHFTSIFNVTIQPSTSIDAMQLRQDESNQTLEAAPQEKTAANRHSQPLTRSKMPDTELIADATVRQRSQTQNAQARRETPEVKTTSEIRPGVNQPSHSDDARTNNQGMDEQALDSSHSITSSIVPVDATTDTALEAVSEAEADYSPDLSEVISQLNMAVQEVIASTADSQYSALLAKAKPSPFLSANQQAMMTEQLRRWRGQASRSELNQNSTQWVHQGQQFHAKLIEQAKVDDTSLQQLVIEVTTYDNGQQFSTRMQMKRLAFSSYAQFVDRWDPNVQLHRDQLNGRFHTNSQINLTSSGQVGPQFYGEVTTTAKRINYSNKRGRDRSEQIFLGGLQTGVKPIHWPRDFVPTSTADNNHQIHRFSQHTRIRFHADGSFSSVPFNSESPPERHQLTDQTHYLIADPRVNLHVAGTVNGKVLVYSPSHIVIEDDIFYAQDPADSPAADDYLGLVADHDVEIAPPHIVGDGDLFIDAAIFAKRRFVVKKYRHKSGAMLHIYGSLTAGSLSATEPRYDTKIEYDKRLEHSRPPGFPMTEHYVVDSWQDYWTSGVSEQTQ